MNRVTQTGHHLHEREEVYPSLSNFHFFIHDLQIFKQTTKCQETLSCFRPRATANLISTKFDNKIYLLTVNKIFKPLLEQYAVMNASELLCFFSHKKEEGRRPSDLALIPIGNYNPDSKELILHSYTCPIGSVHFHI